MVRRFDTLDVSQHQRSPGKQTTRCFQSKTLGIAHAHFIGHRVGFVLRRPQRQHGLTSEQQGRLKGFPHYVIGVMLDQLERMLAVKGTYQQFHLRAVVPRTFDDACRGFFVIYTNDDGAGVMGAGSMQYFMAGTITVIGLETIGLHGTDHLRIYFDNGKFRSLSERCLAGNLTHAAKTDDEYIAL